MTEKQHHEKLLDILAWQDWTLENPAIYKMWKIQLARQYDRMCRHLGVQVADRVIARIILGVKR